MAIGCFCFLVFKEVYSLIARPLPWALMEEPFLRLPYHTIILFIIFIIILTLKNVWRILGISNLIADNLVTFNMVTTDNLVTLKKLKFGKPDSQPRLKSYS